MIREEEIFGVLNNVLQVMLHFDCESINDPDGQAIQTDSNGLVGQIAINGNWNGEVRFLVTKAFASKAASKLLMIDSNTIQEQDLVDTITELTNMIGGNIKSLLPAPSSLSLPCLDSEFQLDRFTLSEVPHLRVQKVLCDQEPLVVVLMRQK